MNEAVEGELLDLLEEITGDSVVRDERDIDLFEEGLLDSIAAIELLVEIETRFGVNISPTELEREEMNTVDKIIARVGERLQ